MHSARRRARAERRKRAIKFGGVWWKILTPLFFVVLIFIFVKVTTRYWNGSDKFTFAFRTSLGDAAVSVLDPKLGEITTLRIPGDTQVDVSGNYGTMRIKNVWQLGMNEKKGGLLLAGTITRNFLFPVFLWSDETGINIGKGDIAGILGFVLSPQNTNIPLGDRISIALFALKVNSAERTEIDLGKSQFLHKVNLNDGQSGYILTGPIASRLTVYFADNNFADKNIRFEIGDATGRFGISDNVGRVVEVVGGKVVSIDQKPVDENTDCLVMGESPSVTKKIANIFGCKVKTGKRDFDVEISLGAKFAKRY